MLSCKNMVQLPYLIHRDSVHDFLLYPDVSSNRNGNGNWIILSPHDAFLISIHDRKLSYIVLPFVRQQYHMLIDVFLFRLWAHSLNYSQHQSQCAVKIHSAAYDCHSSILTVGRCRYRANRCTIFGWQNSAGTERKTFYSQGAEKLLIEPARE